MARLLLFLLQPISSHLLYLISVIFVQFSEVVHRVESH